MIVDFLEASSGGENNFPKLNNCRCNEHSVSKILFLEEFTTFFLKLNKEFSYSFR